MRNLLAQVLSDTGERGWGGVVVAIPDVSLETDRFASQWDVCVREPRGGREGEGAVEEEDGMPQGLPGLPAPHLSRVVGSELAAVLPQ